MSNALSLVTTTTKIATPVTTSIASGALGAATSIINVGVAYYDLQKNKEISSLMEYKNKSTSERINQIATKIEVVHEELELMDIQHKSILSVFEKQLEVIKNEKIIASQKEKQINEHLNWIKANGTEKEYQLALISASEYFISEII